VKRSRRIRLVLIGGLSAGTLASCTPSSSPPTTSSSATTLSSARSVTSSDVFTNNHYVPGVGYYHAPFRAWYLHPYNHYDSRLAKYFYGGQWGSAPFESVINISAPSDEAVRQVASGRTDIRRGGFGSTGRHSTIRS
jgi:hypothetical protein